MTRFAKSRWRTLLLLAGLLCCGCGRDTGPPPPPAYAVAGTLLYDDGKPVPKALVEFVLESDPSLNISGVTADDGTFALKTSYGAHTLSGSIAGRCRVKIVPPCSFSPADPPRTITLPDAYEIKPEANRFVLKIPRRSGK